VTEPTQFPQDLEPLFAHVEAAYPSEGCGVIVAGDKGARIIPLANAYDRYHAKDPQRFPRTSRTAYLFDPKEFLHLQEALDASGEAMVCIFHSHADVGAYFSAEDVQSAAPDGEPLFPGVSYLVVAVDQARVTAAKLFHWQHGSFGEQPFSLIREKPLK
jgi:[CysO sulfur-carrier protein]-S-L-cysteine hydrolase